ncbi:Uncharacterised protein [Mycobacteroides abscessus subsp. abscessus]|nr:Uncharacterised protein [Mycobacteroides abscessus subsp. abscessus]
MSSSSGIQSPYATDPLRVGTSAVAIRSLIAIGTPASGPGSSPRAIVASTAAACSRAKSSVRSTNALRALSMAFTLAIAISTISEAVTTPALIDPAISTADEDSKPRSGTAVTARPRSPSYHEPRCGWGDPEVEAQG